MFFNIVEFSKNIYFTSEHTKKLAAEQIFCLIKPLIDTIIDSVRNNNFNYSKYSFERNPGSGLTNKSGLYLIINKHTKRLYLGGTTNLAQRKGEHKQNLSNPNRINTKLKNKKMFKDLKVGKFDDFCFVPILVFTYSALHNKGEYLKAEKTNEQLSKFLDTYVEKLLLDHYLNSVLKDFFYNEKAVGAFQIGNTFGGSANSGTPSNAVYYKNFAWESISAAANSFGVDRKSIRLKKEKNIMFEITTEEFIIFDGIKITNANARDFSKNYPSDYRILLRELFPRKRASNDGP